MHNPTLPWRVMSGFHQDLIELIKKSIPDHAYRSVEEWRATHADSSKKVEGGSKSKHRSLLSGAEDNRIGLQ